MKNIKYILLAFVLVLALTACSNTNQNEETETSVEAETTVETSAETDAETAETQESSTEVEEVEMETQQETENGDDNMSESSSNVLVAFYSATGNTQNVAKYIASALNADTFQVVPVDEYTDEDLNWRDENSRVSVEHDNEDDRNIALVTTTPFDWEDYDVVFVGYPIWWQEAAWPIDNFIKENDFSGKTVIPFATSASSGLGQSGELLAQMAGSGNWLEGVRFGQNPSQQEVEEWVSNLEY